MTQNLEATRTNYYEPLLMSIQWCDYMQKTETFELLTMEIVVKQAKYDRHMHIQNHWNIGRSWNSISAKTEKKAHTEDVDMWRGDEIKNRPSFTREIFSIHNNIIK